MQYLDNDMDDLFKRAGEHYPLKIAPGDWDKIALLSQPAESVVGINSKRFTSTFLLLVTVLLVAGGLFPLHTRDAVSTVTGQNAIRTGKESPIVITEKNQAANRKIASVMMATGNKKYNISGIQNIQQAGITEQHLKGHSIQNDITIPKKDLTENSDINASLPEREPVTLGIHSIQKKIVKKNSFINNLDTTPVQTIKNKKVNLYFKLDAGIQTSQVKMQGFTKPGLTVELLAGLQLNRRIAVETGIGWSKKYFFTSARYFDMSKVSAGMPNNMVLKSLTGASDIFEIPVSLVYQIRQKKLSAIFISAGLNTFIYSGEHNDYLAMVNGVEQNIAGKYDTHKSYFSAAAELGIGYGFSIGPKSQLMIKPYVQIPLKNVGVGSVQLTTLGLRLGITRYSQH